MAINFVFSAGQSFFNNFLHFLENSYNSNEKPIPERLFKKIDISILSNGGGYTVPRAIKAIEQQTNNKAHHINYDIPDDLNSVALDAEVDLVFKYIEENKLYNSEVSRAAAFIDIVKGKKIEAPLCFSVINKISEIAKNFDCIILPGGEDIPAIWYKNPAEPDIFKGHYRTIIELTLIHQARHQGTPLMGICRGHQIVHVYHGKKLHNSEDGYHGIQPFKLIDENQKGLLANLFQQTVLGRVMHQQGVSIAEAQNGTGDLEPLTVADGLVKAAESKYGAASPVICTQFHPEMYGASLWYGASLSKNNAEFFRILHESAIVKNIKKTCITPAALVEARKQLKSPSQQQPKVKQDPYTFSSFIFAVPFI